MEASERKGNKEGKEGYRMKGEGESVLKLGEMALPIVLELVGSEKEE